MAIIISEVIKLGIMERFAMALDKNVRCYQHLHKKLNILSEAKLKYGISDGWTATRNTNE